MFRGAMVSLIYARTLELQEGVQDGSKSLTLMSTDIDRIASSIESVQEIWARTAELAIGIWLLERQLGWICIAPVIVIIGNLPILPRMLRLLNSCSLYIWCGEDCRTHGPCSRSMDGIDSEKS
jgi:hypothetical protein